ncbi:hypothetical protein ACFFLM_05915 [Deinococcus oregonensis]|uniref:HNH endonuclease n=1 Tax=Deinococcus oregonensis TaxID=1805970 RepID=A0ABV6AVH5_9DEIO
MLYAQSPSLERLLLMGSSEVRTPRFDPTLSAALAKDPSNIMLLCQTCHKEEDGGLKRTSETSRIELADLLELVRNQQFEYVLISDQRPITRKVAELEHFFEVTALTDTRLYSGGQMYDLNLAKPGVMMGLVPVR